MRQFLAQILGLDRELRLKDAAIRRQREQIEALKKGKGDAQSRANFQSKRAADLTELLEAQQEQAALVLSMLRAARRYTHLKNSGPAIVHRHLSDAIQLLEGDKQ